MKNKHIWIALLLAIIAVAIWFLKKKEARMPRHEDLRTNTIKSSEMQISASNSAASHPSALVTNNFWNSSEAAAITARYNQGLITKGEAIQEILMNENKKPLDIYGKVVDQYGNPVSEAKIRGAIGINVSFVKSGGEYHYTKTDSNGRFQFLGIHGVGIGIWPQKEGYDYNFRLPSQRPDDYQPDYNNPVVFTMWKLRGPEPLIGASIDAKIPHDGSPVIFETTSGKESPAGDLRVTLSQFPLDVKNGRTKFDWNAKVEILNGGLLEENDPYPYWTPTTGYQSSFEFNVSSNAVKWLPNLKRNFYIKNAQGQYGIMQFSIYPGRPPTGLEINFTINPSGSQNLEPALKE